MAIRGNRFGVTGFGYIGVSSCRDAAGGHRFPLSAFAVARAAAIAASSTGGSLDDHEYDPLAQARLWQRRNRYVKNWSLRSGKAMIIGELAAAERSEMQALRHARNAGEEWINVKAELGERGINIAEWCRQNMPVSRQWLDRHAELHKNWAKFIAAKKWADQVGYSSRRQTGLEFALEVITAKDRSDLLSKESKLAYVPPSEPFQNAQGGAADKTNPIHIDRNTTLYHGDCRDALKSIPEGTIDLVLADPPYFLRQKDWSLVDDLLTKNGMTPRLREAWDRFDDIDAYLEFTTDWINEAMRVLTPQGSLFVFGTYHCIGLINYAMQRLGITILHHIAWVKRNSKPNLSTRRLQLSNETIIWAVKSDKYRFHYRATKSADYPGDPLKKPSLQMRDVWDVPTSPHQSIGHPSQKPTAIYDRILDLAGLPGGVLLDPFAGSGTAAISAANHNMKCVMIERDPRYIDLIRARVQAESPTIRSRQTRKRQ